MQYTLISEMPTNLRELAESRRKEHPIGSADITCEDRLYYAFAWNATPEGYEFWRELFLEAEYDDDDEWDIEEFKKDEEKEDDIIIKN